MEPPSRPLLEIAEHPVPHAVDDSDHVQAFLLPGVAISAGSVSRRLP